MKTGTIKIGTKGYPAVKVPINEPENLDDLNSLAKGNPNVIIRWAIRGHRIESQERSGARDTFRELRAAGKSDAEVTAECAKIVAEFDPTKSVKRGTSGRTRKPREVNIVTPASGKMTLDEFRKQLEAQGVKVNFGGDQAAAAATTA